MTDFTWALNNALSRNDFAGSVLNNDTTGKAEQSFWWTHPGKQACHASAVVTMWLMTWLLTSKLVVRVVLSPDRFTKTIVNFNYHLAAAHYLQGTGAKRFIFIAVEKVFPYSVGIYQLSQSLLTKAMNSKSRHFKKYLKQLQQIQWRGYTNACPDGIQTLTPPKWI